MTEEKIMEHSNTGGEIKIQDEPCYMISKMYQKLENKRSNIFTNPFELGPSFLWNNIIQYTTMGNIILIIDCNYLFLFCFYFASQWTGWATQPVYLLCPMYVYIICNIDINVRCIVLSSSRLSHSSLFLYHFQCFTYGIVLFLYISYLIFNLFLLI